jgi:glycosyltransferase involved in cell wall biosynthesis
MPKLLIVIARLNKGGTAQYIGQLATQLPKHGYQVLVATGHVQGHEIEDEIIKKILITRIKRLGRKISPINDLKARNELKNVIKEFKPDLIYSHTFKAGAITRSIKTDIPIIHAFHGHLLDEPELAGIKVKIATAIERKLAPKAKFLVAVGKRVSKELLEVGVGNPSQFVSIPPGVPSLKLQRKSIALKKLNLAQDVKPNVVWLARMVSVKRPDRVIDLAKAIPEARFIMAGGGELLSSIRSQAPKNLEVLQWSSPADVYSISDISISTSVNEGMPISLIEAQLAGVPVIALDVGSIAEVVQDGKTGYLLPEFDNEFIKKLRKLLKDKRLRNQFGKSAKKRAKKEFDPGRLIQDHLRLFQKTI